MSDLVRVRDTETGHHYTVAVSFAKAHEDTLEILEEHDPVGLDGLPALPKFKEDMANVVEAASAQQRSARKVAQPVEEAK